MHLSLIRVIAKVLRPTVTLVKKNWKLLLMVLSGLLLLWRPVTLRAEFSSSIPHADPTDVWEFMAVFANYKTLNSKLLDFKIVDNNFMNHHHGHTWKYSVLYTEHFENIPIGTNTALGHYKVYQNHDTEGSGLFDEEHDLVISSTHITCLLPFSTWCLSTQAEDRFRWENKGTFVVEVIDYQCPWILQAVCRAEVNSQRTRVLDTLRDVEF